MTAPDYAPPLDERDAPAFDAALRALRSGYVPEWLPGLRGADAAALQTAAHLLQAIARRLNQAPDKNKLAFLEVAGIRLVPAQPARAPVVFVLADNVADVALPAGTRIAAPPPPGNSTQISYETETSAGLAVAKLRDVVSLWPGRDQYLDHSAALAAQQPFQLFHKAELVNTPHELYIAHDRLLALAGQSTVSVSFELTTPSGEYLDIRWEYWDGTVWRGFLDMRPACSNAQAAQLDSTDGLRTSGVYLLRTDCAETAKTTVDGVEAFWVRGRLEETEPPDPARVLPEVESIRLSTTIARSYTTIWRTSVGPDPQAQLNVIGPGVTTVDDLAVRVVDATGVPLSLIDVANRNSSSSAVTDDQGRARLNVNPGQPNAIVVALDNFEQEQDFTPDPDTPQKLTFTLDMLALDKAIADGADVNLSQPFFPLGVQPRPGAAFYFSHEEAFGKPGAQLRIYMQPAPTPDRQLATAGTSDETPVEHVVSWEYWNGRAWVSLRSSDPTVHTGQPEDFLVRGLIELTVPIDLTSTTVNDQEGRWMRARLVSGGYGFIKTVPIGAAQPVIEAAAAAPAPSFTFFVAQPPAVGDLRLGYTWQDGPYPPEHVLTFNDFQYTDRTFDAVWPGRTFAPFTPVADATPALYLGFDGKLPVANLGLFFAVVEQRGDSLGPDLAWEYWDGLDWRRVLVADQTRHLRVPGLVSFIGPEESQSLARFGTPRYWLRTRLIEDGPPGEPVIGAIYNNAVPAMQRQTTTDEPLGTSTGQPNQVFQFRQLPILPDPVIEMRELQGARAEVEWRILATELFPGPRALQELETQVGADGPGTDVQLGPLRLVRDRSKRVVEAWVRWIERPTLSLSGPQDRDYALDHARARVFFGDGEHGRIPPSGAAIVARQYRTGGGSVGNVPARAISQLLGPVGGVEQVFNPVPGEGGADGETGPAVLSRGPSAVRHRERAVTAEDYAALAREASPSVAVARALPGRDSSGRPAPGWVTVVIIPRSAEPRPYPPFGLREQVRRFLAERAAADVAAADQIVVTGPDYVPVEVSASIVPRDPTEAGAVEQAARAAIAAFLHPLTGGPAGRGWSPGEDVWLSDLAPVLERVPGVDHVSETALRSGDKLFGEHVPIADDRIPVAGDIRLRLVGG